MCPNRFLETSAHLRTRYGFRQVDLPYHHYGNALDDGWLKCALYEHALIRASELVRVDCDRRHVLLERQSIERYNAHSGGCEYGVQSTGRIARLSNQSRLSALGCKRDCA